jgi:hypothetical protein
VSARERERARTGSGLGLVGLWAPSEAGPKAIPRAFSYFLFFFLFSFSGFLFLFLSFAKMLQINSNFFHKFCKIPSIVLKQ